MDGVDGSVPDGEEELDQVGGQHGGDGVGAHGVLGGAGLGGRLRVQPAPGLRNVPHPVALLGEAGVGPLGEFRLVWEGRADREPDAAQRDEARLEVLLHAGWQDHPDLDKLHVPLDQEGVHPLVLVEAHGDVLDEGVPLVRSEGEGHRVRHHDGDLGLGGDGGDGVGREEGEVGHPHEEGEGVPRVGLQGRRRHVLPHGELVAKVVLRYEQLNLVRAQAEHPGVGVLCKQPVHVL